MTLGDRVKSTRQARQMTIAALAGTSGLTKGFISQLEHGRSNPSLESLGRIAASLGVPAQALLADQGRVLLEHIEQGSLPVLFRQSDWSSEGSSVTPLQTGQAVTCAAVRLTPGGALQGGPDLSQSGAPTFCVVLDGDAVFTQGNTELVLSQGDSLVWNTSETYVIENRSSAPTSLLVVVEARSRLPDLRAEVPDYYDNVRRASSQALVGDGPLRLVALREQMRNRRGG